MSKKKSLKINAFLNTIRTILNIIFPLITFPYISRILQVESIGIYNFCNSILSYFVLIAGLGITSYAIREGTQYRNDRNLISNFVSDVFSINIYSTIISYLFLFLTIFFIKQCKDYSNIILILSLEIIFNTLGVNWVCNIFEDFLFITLQSLFIQILSLVLTFLFVKSQSDLLTYVYIVVFSRVSANILNFVYIKIKFCNFKFKFKCNIKTHLLPILVIFSSSIAVTVYVSSDTTMLGFIKDEYQVGLYSTSVKIYTITKSVISSIVSVLIPRFAYLLNTGNEKEAKKLFSTITNTLIILIFPITIGLFLTSSDIIQLIGGVNYLPASTSLKLLSFAIIFSLFSFLFINCILLPQKKEKIVLIATTISAAVNILLNLFFIPLFGLNGAAVTTIIAELIVCLICCFSVRKEIFIENFFKNLFSVIFSCCIITLEILFIQKMIKLYLIRLISCILISVISYFIILFLTKNQVLLNLIKRNKNERLS